MNDVLDGNMSIPHKDSHDELRNLGYNGADIRGRYFGRWLVKELVTPVERSLRRHPKWICACVCGKIKSVDSNNLIKGKTLSCGCLVKETSSRLHKRHGMSGKHPIYAAWVHIRQRCSNPRQKFYYLYGGRGIRVCDRWMTSFEHFWEDVSPSWVRGLSLDRIDVNGDYRPDNCRWTTMRVQSNNRQRTKYLTLNKETLSLRDWSRRLNMKWNTLWSRVRAGWSDEKILTTPETITRHE